MLDASIIIPCYNGERYISSIKSVLEPYYNQGPEIIFVNDGSTDNSLSGLRANFPNAIIVDQINQGLAAARNTGAKLSTRKYLQFLDIDDRIPEEKIGNQIQRAERDQLDVVFSDWRMVLVDENNQLEKEPIVRAGEQVDYIESLLQGWWVPFHSYLFRRQQYWNVEGSNPELRNAQDFELVLRMAIKNCRFGYLEGNASEYFRFLAIESLARSSRRRYWLDTEKVISEAISALKQKDELKRKYRNAAAIRLHLVARNIFSIDRNWYRQLIIKIKELNPQFHPQGSQIFKITSLLMGLYKGELLAHYIRKMKRT